MNSSKQVMDAETAFARVSDWWQQEHTTWVSDYEAKNIPDRIPGRPALAR